ncbi:MAG: response regulator transcription factor [Verrucomicrobiae bacterium]|nr:response regulator transcription factor [Verrucomicrobiae bacterium]
MKDRPGIVFLLDDEPGMLKALERLLRAEGFDVRPFARARDFLEAYRPGEDGCLVLDVSMPELDGMELQRQLAQAGISLPVVFLTGRGDIPMSVRAMKAGAVDFLTKPVNDSDLLRAVRAALREADERRAAIAEAAVLGARFQRLTPREREVMGGVVAGKLNKQIAADLGTGEQNIKVHRGRVMRKMGVSSVADLVRAAQKLATAREC